MVTIRLLIEGGGERGMPSKGLAVKMRQSFKLFISSAGIDQGDFTVERWGSRGQAFSAFINAFNNRPSSVVPLLLVDSEDPIPVNTNPWDFVQKRDGWNRPEGVRDEHLHLMTQCMETWFLADMEALEKFFGNGFHKDSLPKTQPIEDAYKTDILNGLDSAARNTTKQCYDKGDHSFAILAMLDPVKVQEKSPWCKTPSLLTISDDSLDNGIGTGVKN
ncbi:MAG: DUF4276 family protein [Magnetococcales bacterium]|nr:DUF4276 family protein [Magnetococcales bacterium]